MELTDLKEMSEHGENKSTDKFQHRKEKVKSTAPYVNTTIVPDNTSTIQNEDHEYEDLQQTTQLQSIKPTEGGLFKRIEKQLIYIVLVIQVILLVAVVAIAVIISSSKSTHQSNQRVDGGWSVWGQWSDCSASCNTGMASRNRSCSSPKPSNGGDYCVGESAEYRLCNTFACSDQPDQGVDGGWSVWGSWSGCSASCGTGMESRYRSCSNPKPSKGGNHCYGDSTEYRLCNKLACPDVHVGFAVYNGDSSSGTYPDPLKFLQTIYNSDGSFNTSTGVFTCIYPGLYFFSATVMRTTKIGEYLCHFVVNNVPSIKVVANDISDSASLPQSSASIVLRLNKNDRVNLGYCRDGSYMFPSGVSFTGFRISP